MNTATPNNVLQRTVLERMLFPFAKTPPFSPAAELLRYAAAHGLANSMYFTNLQALKQDLVAGPLTSGEQFKYLLAWAICSGASHSSAYEGLRKWTEIDWAT
jgi:hypothetical protein